LLFSSVSISCHDGCNKHFEVGDFFDIIYVLLNVVGASCMRTDRIRKNYRKKVEEGICNGKLNTGNVLNQELSLQKPANTRWGTHYKTLLRIIEFFSCIIEYIEYIQDEDVDNIKRRQANGLLKYFHTFDFAFYLQLMLHILGFADILSQALQRRDQDILNVMSLVASTKREVHNLRDDGWDDFLAKVCSFSEQNNMEMLIKDEEFVNLHNQLASLQGGLLLQCLRYATSSV